MKLKNITNDGSLKNYKINIKLNSYYKDKFYVNDEVITKADRQKGIISKINSDFIFVTYADKTIERFNKNNAREFLEYIDDVEEQVSPLTPQNLQADDFSNIPISKVAEREYKKVKQKKVIDEKEQKIIDIVKLGIQKGLIDKDDFEQEKLACSLMNDEDLQDYIDNINEFSSQSIVTSKTDDVDPNLSEAERMLLRIKENGPVSAGNIDFNKFSSNSNSRSLMDIAGVPTGMDAMNKTASSGFTLPPVLSNISTENENKQFNKYSFLNDMDWSLYSRN